MAENMGLKGVNLHLETSPTKCPPPPPPLRLPTHAKFMRPIELLRCLRADRKPHQYLSAAAPGPALSASAHGAAFKVLSAVQPSPSQQDWSLLPPHPTHTGHHTHG